MTERKKRATPDVDTGKPWSDGQMGFVTLFLGFIILLFGRTLFWLAIAIAGFLVGTEYAHVMFAAHAQWVVLTVAIGAGVVGAVLAVMVKRVAFALVGFYAGIYLGLIVVQAIGVASHIGVWCFVSGAIGAMVAALLMDWAIIGCSSLVGAGAIVGALGLGQMASTIAFIVLVVTGTLVQTRRLYDAEAGG